ncbi:FAR1-related sequence 5-like protein, partial [Tanacetum coccineum]
YGYKFEPFTGIDHHQKCVTFGAALLSDETTESFCWMLEEFLKMHKKETTEEGDLAVDTKFRKDFHKLVWNVYIGPEVFEKLWDDMITRYNLHDNKWLSDMYTIRERWVPGYFKEVPICSLMKTTSRSESSNLFFQVVIDKIPDAYINRRWTKTALPAHLLDKRHRYGPCIEETDTLASQLEDETQKPNVELNKEALYADLLGKAKKIARTNRKVPFKWRTCNACGGKGHNKATCKGYSACGEAGHHKGICKRFPNQDKDEVVDEDKGDNEDKVDDEDEVDNEDEVDDEDEVDEEYESEEE